MSYSRKSEARSIARGAVRIPGGLLPPLAAQALDKLLASGYAPSKAKVIAKALVAAEISLIPADFWVQIKAPLNRHQEPQFSDDVEELNGAKNER